MPRHLLADDESAHGWSDDRRGAERADLRRQGRAELLDQRHLLQGQRALEKLAAVPSAAKEEMPFQERAGFAEKLQGIFVRHGRA